ncbi:MAG: hypothetical protein H7A23_01535 [Leptospiraceae bacterium]|nr:hypothetical protein [Leptospiraceae bacterium]MCP5493214.1 hypothetical protein [Leptospiraceae bacterium]
MNTSKIQKRKAEIQKLKYWIIHKLEEPEKKFYLISYLGLESKKGDIEDYD